MTPMSEIIENEKAEIRKLASQLEDKLRGSQWYKTFYEKAMTVEGNAHKRGENDDIVFDFEEMEIETFPEFEQNQSNLVLKWGYELDEEREARINRLMKEESEKWRNL